MKKTLKDKISDKLVNAFLKNKIISPIPKKFTKKLTEADKFRKLCESKIKEPVIGFKVGGTGIPLMHKLKEKEPFYASIYKRNVLKSGEKVKINKSTLGIELEVCYLIKKSYFSSKNPIILAGNGTVRKRASNRLRILAKNLGIGVINTFMGKGAVSKEDEHCLFTIGLGSGDFNNLAIDESDLVIAIGYDLVEYSPSAWNRIEKGKKKIIHIDYTPAEIDKDYLPNVEIIADLAGALFQLNKELISKVSEKNLPLFNIKGRKKLRDAMIDDLEMNNYDESFPMKPQRVLSDVRKFMEDDDIVLSDVGAHKMWVAREYNCTIPNTCLISNGFCTMGFALPGSIGAKMAFPEKKILSINGDAGFLMNVQDLETAVRYKINIVAVVWLDGEYGLIKWKQQVHFDGEHSELRFKNPNFEFLAKSLNMWGKQIKSANEFLPALTEAFKQDGPAIIGIPIDYEENMRLTERLGKVSAII